MDSREILLNVLPSIPQTLTIPSNWGRENCWAVGSLKMGESDDGEGRFEMVELDGLFVIAFGGSYPKFSDN